MTISLDGPLLLVGAGKMGGALLAGWLGRGLDPASVFIQDPQPADEVASLARGAEIPIGSEPALPGEPAVVVLAVKPQMMDAVLPALKARIGAGSVVLSIAAGYALASMEKHFGDSAAIVRSMPNTPAAVGRGITVACPNAAVTPAQKETCDALLAAVGQCAWIDDESLLDAVTAVSGSGPAYIFLLTECLAEAGIQAGLDAELAMRLARATVSGAGELMHQSDLEPAQLRKNVTSPGGTTAAALEILMGEAGLQGLMTRAVRMAAKRSRELSS